MRAASNPLLAGGRSTLGVDRNNALEIEITLDSERRDGRVVYDSKGTLLSAKEN